ncbi:MAG: hypothetical protein JNM18_23475 [Planctomycetaceae bacterium]|nr:hypothetical protein [Planctomycetaceae bacterium]
MWLIVACGLMTCSQFTNRALGAQPWPVNGPYEPRHVCAALAAVVHESQGLPVGGDPPLWFQVATVDYSCDPRTPAGRIDLNALANYIPPANLCLFTGNQGGRRLDHWYEYLLNNIAFPYVPKSPEVKAAEKLLYDTDPATGEVRLDESGEPVLTPAYKNYKAKRSAYLYWEAMNKWKEEVSPEEKAKARAQWLQAREALEEAMSRGIGAAVESLQGFWHRDGASRNLDRIMALRNYRDRNTLEQGVNGPPLSYFVPPVETWLDDAGWYATSFSQVDAGGRYERHARRYSRGGDLGFVTIGGGKTEVKEYLLPTVRQFSYKLELKRVLIFRPWFDVSLLEDRGWTWREKKAGAYPLVARAPGAEGVPVESPDVYKMQSVGLPLIPVELILAKDLEISARVGKAEWDRAKTAAQAGGGVLFGVIPLDYAEGNERFTEVVQGDDVLLTARRPNAAILGAVSRVCSAAPRPDPDAGIWPDGAWKPWE